jgi:hypothetical protein
MSPPKFRWYLFQSIEQIEAVKGQVQKWKFRILRGSGHRKVHPGFW